MLKSAAELLDDLGDRINNGKEVTYFLPFAAKDLLDQQVEELTRLDRVARHLFQPADVIIPPSVLASAAPKAKS